MVINLRYLDYYNRLHFLYLNNISFSPRSPLH